MGKRPGDGAALPHAAGQFHGIFVNGIGQPHQVEVFFGLRPPLPPAEGGIGLADGEGYVFHHAQPGKQGVVLEYHPALDPGAGDSPSLPADLTAIRLFQARQQAQQGRFA